MNVFLALLTGLTLCTTGVYLVSDLYRRRQFAGPGDEVKPGSEDDSVPEGMVRLLIYECPRCERRNRLKEGLDPRFARCGRCFAEMANATLVGDEIAPAEPDVADDPAAVWVLRHEDLPSSRPLAQSPSRTVPSFEIPNPLPEEINWKSVDPLQTSLTRDPAPTAQRTRLSPEEWPDIIGNVDPVTGTPIKAGEKVFICTHCTTAYHEQTWQYLREQNAGACASCNRQKTIVPYHNSP
jgi:hypothetical protein